MSSIFEIKIPATSANLGLGFDSMGLAINKYLTLKAEEADVWSFSFENPALEVLENDETNLVARIAQATAERFDRQMPALAVRMDSEIPLAHGLGSSSSAIVGGIELANHFLNLNLSDYDKVKIGSDFEGHPDNIGPCVTGGVFVGYYEAGELYYQTCRLEGISLIVSVPNYEISTEEVRKVIPDNFEKADAIGQNAKNNVMLLAMVNGDYDSMGSLMQMDRFHEPYRKPLIKEFDQVESIGQKLHAYATVISGAGPTMLTLCDSEKAPLILKALQGTVTDCQHEMVEVHY